MRAADPGADLEPGTLSERDATAFREQLVDTLPHLRAFARALCGRPDFADDLVQETAIRAWTARERFTPGTNLRAWTFAILRNHYLDQWRRDRRQMDYDPDAAEKLLVMDADQEGPLHLSDMEDALRKLSPERREAILLIGAAGFSYEDAAEICGCAVGTMKSRVARARVELARILDPEDADSSAVATRLDTGRSDAGRRDEGRLDKGGSKTEQRR